jgi:hypothetical protein
VRDARVAALAVRQQPLLLLLEERCVCSAQCALLRLQERAFDLPLPRLQLPFLFLFIFLECIRRTNTAEKRERHKEQTDVTTTLTTHYSV